MFSEEGTSSNICKDLLFAGDRSGKHKRNELDAVQLKLSGVAVSFCAGLVARTVSEQAWRHLTAERRLGESDVAYCLRLSQTARLRGVGCLMVPRACKSSLFHGADAMKPVIDDGFKGIKETGRIYGSARTTPFKIGTFFSSHAEKRTGDKVRHWLIASAWPWLPEDLRRVDQTPALDLRRAGLSKSTSAGIVLYCVCDCVVIVLYCVCDCVVLCCDCAVPPSAAQWL